MAKKLTAQQIADWDNHSDDVDGKFVPVDPEGINIAREVDEVIKLFGIEEAAEHAAFRAECAHHKEDRDDWTEVERIILERKAEQLK